MNRLFGTSGIRGISNKDLTPLLAMKVGLAAVTESENGKALIAYDTRTSSQMFLHAITAGLLSGGVNVEVIGLTTTPALAYLTKILKAKFGVMLTASHNPPEYNGIKLFDNEGIAYNEVRENRIADILHSTNFRFVDWDKIGTSSYIEHEIDRYIEFISNTVEFDKTWQVAIDPGCGASSNIAPAIFEKLNFRFISINSQPSGFFLGRPSEPSEDSLTDLSLITKKLGLDAGIAYDGDADRMAIIDEKGTLVSMDKALAAYSSHLIEKEKGCIVVPIDTSMCVDEAVQEKGGEVLRTGIGDVKVAEVIKKNGAIFGGEVSGAWINPKFHLCPDGILSSILFLKAVEEEQRSVSSFISEINSYPILRTKVNCPNKSKQKTMKLANEMIKKEFSNIKEIQTMDGLRISTESGWLLIRPSGTEPIIRIVSEANTMKIAKEYLEIGEQIVKKASKGKIK